MLLFMESSRAKFCYDLYCFPNAAVASAQCFSQHIRVIVKEFFFLHRASNICASVVIVSTGGQVGHALHPSPSHLSGFHRRCTAEQSLDTNVVGE